MADDFQKNFEIDFSTKFSDDGAKKASSAIKGIAQDEQHRGEVSKSASQQSSNQLEAYSKLATKVGVSAAAGLASIKLMQNTFLDTAKGATATSQQWLKTTDQVQQSMYKIGKTITQEMLPGYKTLANVTSDVANFIQKNPVLTQVGTYAIGGAAVLAAGVKAVSFGKGVIQEAQGMFGGGGAIAGTEAATQAAAVQTAAADTFAGTVTAAGETFAATVSGAGAADAGEQAAGGALSAGEEVGGAVVGGAAAGAVGATVTGGGAAATAGVVGGEVAGGAALGIGGVATGGLLLAGAALIGGLIYEASRKNPSAPNTGTTPSGRPNTPKAGAGTSDDSTSFLASSNPNDMTQQQLMEAKQFQEQETQQDEQYQIQTLRAQRDFNLQQSYAEQDYQKTTMRATRDFNIQQEYAQQDYQTQVMRSTRDFNIQQTIQLQQYQLQQSIATRDFYISQTRAQEDYQLQQSRATQDYNFSVKMAMMQGDSLGIYMAQYQYNLQKSRAKQDFDIQQQRSKEDFGLQQQDAANQFNITRTNEEKQFQIQESDAAYDFNLSRARQLQQYQIQMSDAETDFNIQRTRANEQFKIQMSDMDYNYQLQRRDMKQQYIDQIIPELMDEGDTRAKLQAQFGANYTKQIHDMYVAASQGQVLNYPPTNQIAGSSDIGGYVSAGLWRMHEGEFVLNADTTATAERAAQGRNLDQNSIRELLGGAGKPSMVNNFNRGVPADERYQLEREFEQLVKGAF